MLHEDLSSPVIKCLAAAVIAAAIFALYLAARPPSVEETIGVLENDPDALNRAGAAKKLGVIADRNCAARLISIFEREKDPMVKAQMADMFVKLHVVEALPALRAMLPFVEAENSSIIRSAIDLLEDLELRASDAP